MGGGAVVVVVVAWGGWVVVVADEPAALPDVDGVGWMTPRTSTVVITNPASTMSALATGYPPPRPPEAAGGRVDCSGGWATACQPANPRAQKQAFRIWPRADAGSNDRRCSGDRREGP